MFDPESNIAEQLAYALRHHQKNQQNLKSTQKEIEKLRKVLAEYDATAEKAESASK